MGRDRVEITVANCREIVAVITAGVTAENVAEGSSDRISDTPGAILDSTMFSGSYFEATDLSMAVLTRASFAGAQFEMNNGRACNFDGVQADGAIETRRVNARRSAQTLTHPDLLASHAQCDHSSFDGAQFESDPLSPHAMRHMNCPGATFNMAEVCHGDYSRRSSGSILVSTHHHSAVPLAVLSCRSDRINPRRRPIRRRDPGIGDHQRRRLHRIDADACAGDRPIGDPSLRLHSAITLGDSSRR